MTLHMDLRVEEAAWQDIKDLEALCLGALQTAYGQSTTEGHVDVLLADNDTLETLNTDWRGKPRPTDVLSFPAGENPENFLGDIAIAYGIASKDAAAGQKTLPDHLCHLLIHGLLHLMGHDHMHDDEAETMETLERDALARLGIADPYSRIVTQ